VSQRINEEREGETDPMGVKVSMPLAAVQGRLLDFATSWTFLAVMSTARAGKHENRAGGSGNEFGY
jgi:hypothetical protein